MSGRHVFVDTGAWLALALRDDTRHGEAERAFKDLLSSGARLITTNLVTGETYTFLARAREPRIALAFVEHIRASIALDYVHADEGTEMRAYEWLKKYDDQRFSYVDAVSFAVMAEMGIREAFTFDRHFETAGFLRVPS